MVNTNDAAFAVNAAARNEHPPTRIFDPIHHFIEIDELEAALLDVAPMQRLRRLRQLGLAYLAYPSAEHSRFSHALGALAVGTRALDGLRRHCAWYFASERDYVEQRRLLRASLLLHDIGHGPFSHACEAVLGIAHEARTHDLLRLPEIARLLERLEVDRDLVLGLIVGDSTSPYPVLRELVSGPNLDADRMDYLIRDAYFTGVVNGRYDIDQLVESLRVFEIGGRPELGVDARGVVALESFVLARYMMFATVYFHHTTRAFERTLQDTLVDVWPNPTRLNAIDEFVQWDDFRVLDVMRTLKSEAASGLRERTTMYRLVAEFNGERDLLAFERCRDAIVSRWGDVCWADSQQQLMHRLPLGADAAAPTVRVSTLAGVLDARQASDVIARLSTKAYWYKLFVKRGTVPIDEARRLCREITIAGR